MLQVVSGPLYFHFLNEPGNQAADSQLLQSVGHLQASELGSTPWGVPSPCRNTSGKADTPDPPQ